MYLERLVLRHFRAFKEAEVIFSPELNCIQGDNAEGKTSLLEAIVFLSTGRSFRTKMLKELIQHDAPFFYLEAHFKRGGLSHRIKVYFDGSRRELHIDDTQYNSFNPLLGILPTILYAPEHLSIVTGPPAERRQFLDLHLSQLDPQYLYHISRYTGAMKQRNALLKQESEVGIESWEEIMADSSSYLLRKRFEAITHLLPPMRETLLKLSEGRDHLDMHYRSTVEEGRSFRDQLRASRPKELAYGSSLIGPHRDDFVMTLCDKPARLYASEGQKRCLLAALRFGQWQRVSDTLAQVPILSIDDFGAHLDHKRRSFLQEQMDQRGQVFLTAPHFDSQTFSGTKIGILTVRGGKICTQ